MRSLFLSSSHQEFFSKNLAGGVPLLDLVVTRVNLRHPESFSRSAAQLVGRVTLEMPKILCGHFSCPSRRRSGNIETDR